MSGCFSKIAAFCFGGAAREDVEEAQDAFDAIMVGLQEAIEAIDLGLSSDSRGPPPTVQQLMDLDPAMGKRITQLDGIIDKQVVD